MRPGAERNLSGWLVREAVSEMSAAREGRGKKARKPSSKVFIYRSAFTKSKIAGFTKNDKSGRFLVGIAII